MSGTKLCVLGLAVFALALCAAGAPVCSDVCIKASAENSYVVRTGSKQTSRSLPGQGGCHSQEDMRDADFEDGDSSYVVVDIVGGKSNLKSDTFTFRPSYTNGATCTYTVTGPDKDPKLTFSSKAGCLTCSSG